MESSIGYKKTGDGEYEVVLNGSVIGKVYRREGFSYRGTNGWNSGIRCQDFHPTVWHFTTDYEFTIEYRRAYRTRKRATEELIAHVKQAAP